MGHPLRWFEPGAVYEVTTRTVREQLLLRPCALSTALILGVLGRAHALFPRVYIHYFIFMSNHVHLYLSADDGQSLASFVGFVNGNVARQIGRLRGLPGPLWGRRARPIRIVDEDAMVDRLRYLLAQGCKEGLVASPAEWAGASAFPAFVGDMTMWGAWYDRDGETRARRAKLDKPASDFRIPYPIHLTAIPAWKDLDPDVRRARQLELVEQVVAETRAQNRELGRAPLGMALVLAQDPQSTPVTVKRSPAPLCHATTAVAREAFRGAYRAFVAAYREASRAVRASVAGVLFPEGAFPCGAPFVTWGRAGAPGGSSVGASDGPSCQAPGEVAPSRR